MMGCEVVERLTAMTGLLMAVIVWGASPLARSFQPDRLICITLKKSTGTECIPDRVKAWPCPGYAASAERAPKQGYAAKRLCSRRHGDKLAAADRRGRAQTRERLL